MPRIAFYGDDFTGSVDALLQFRRAGLSGVLVTRSDAEVPAGDHAVVGIAGIARSLPADEMATEVTPALSRLLELDPDLVQYKACSTADSSPKVGSLGRVIELARILFPAAPIPVVFAQPDFGRYTFFGHHFARDGDRVYRLDRQPTMINHPVTPATTSDLREHLARQTTLPIGSVHWPTYAEPDRLAAAVNQANAAAVVCDAFTDDQLDQIASAILSDRRQPRFVLGAGGLSGALGRMIKDVRRLPAIRSDATPAPGPTLVISGSTSERTRQQIESATQSGWTMINAFAPDAPQQTATALAVGSPVVVSSAGIRSVPNPSQAVEIRLAEIADLCLRQDPKTRLIICGGDTSGNVLRRLGIATLTITSQPWGNVALCQATGPQPHLNQVEVVLKGGQMGHLELFENVRYGEPFAHLRERPNEFETTRQERQ